MKEVLNYIIDNRLGSTEVADGLGKKGVLQLDLQPLIPGTFLAGEVQYMYTMNESNWPIHEQAENALKDKVVYIDSIDCANKALFGELVAKFFILYKGVKGLVVNGRLRDIPHLKKYGFPIFFTGTSPLGVYNRQTELTIQQKTHIEKRMELIDGSLIVCDDSGVTFIDKSYNQDELLNRMIMIEAQEDIWSYCINVLKWSTYRTICMKDYLSHPEVLPPHFKEIVRKIQF
jgi:regulator of RNase E activity RraA